MLVTFLADLTGQFQPLCLLQRLSNIVLDVKVSKLWVGVGRDLEGHHQYTSESTKPKLSEVTDDN